MNSMSKRLLLACVCTLLWAACGPYQVTAERYGVPLAEPLPVLVIAEPELGYDHSPADEYLRTLALIDALGGNENVAVVAPWEVDVRAGESWPEGRAVATAAMADQGIDPGRALVLTFQLEHASTTRVVVPTNDMLDGPQVAYKADAVLRLVALDARGGEQIARVEVAFEDDPFVDGGDPADLHPRFTEAIDRAARRLRIELDAVYGQGPPESVPTLGARYGATDLVSYGLGGEPLATELARLDGLDATAARLAWHMRVEPGIDVGTARGFDALPPALFVTSVGPVAGAAGLQSGDFIVSIDGRAARGPHVWTRAFARPEPRREVPVEVVRGSERITLYVPSGR